MLISEQGLVCFERWIYIYSIKKGVNNTCVSVELLISPHAAVYVCARLQKRGPSFKDLIWGKEKCIPRCCPTPKNNAGLFDATTAAVIR